MALKQACSTDCHRAQGAFKDSMIHGILQFTLPIAFRCVLHRWENQEIRCRKLCIVCWPVTVQPSSTFILTIRVCSEERPQERPQKTSLKPFSKTVHTGLWMYSGCRRPGTLFWRPYGLPKSSLMILLQVHLQKPCYYFYFL